MAPNGKTTDADATEVTPLLASSPVAPTQDSDIAETLVASPTSEAAPKPEDKPLPKRQIILLCYARFVEPVAFFSIFPYISQMIQFNGNLPVADVGFYSGLIESLFSLTQMVVMIFWAKAADRVGRKPVLVFSLIGVSIATGIFGLATTLWQMILFRCLAGVFAGTIVTIRTMISEHSTAKTQALSFSWFAFSGNLGILFGPLIGGILAEPATQYPRAFGGVRFFRDYPYALSSFAVGFIGITAVLTSVFFIEETLKKEPKGNTGGENGDPKPGPKSTWQLIKSPGVGIVIYLYMHVMLLAFAYTAVLPVFWFTSVPLGGLGFTPLLISIFMGLAGFSQAFWLLVIFPPLQHRLGTNGVMRLCAVAYPFAMAVSPLMNLGLRSGARTLFWVLMPLFGFVAPGVSMAFTAVQLALNDVCPSPETLGTLNALALTGISAVRSFSPALFTSIFAIGVRTQILAGHLVWAVIVTIAVGFTVATRFLPEASEKDFPDDGTRQAVWQGEVEGENTLGTDDDETLRGD
ncbi:MFS general substrate transporter [Xylariales sp. AK1849]|nr:MFS general substrate transporter [Xylariales sp. AK1849]